MGLDLRLLPLYNQYSDFSQDVLTLNREYYLFNIIEEKEKELGIEINDEGIDSFLSRDEKYEEEHHYGKTLKSYGEKMKYLLAKHLKDALSGYKSTSWRNKAIISFINELPDNLPVYLYWH